MDSPAPILVVEDSLTQAQLLRYMLEQQGHAVRVAENGRVALEAIRSGARPWLVISDITMPEMDGFELCRALRAEDAFRSIRIILMTTIGDGTEIAPIMECGADALLIKPVVEELLIRIIERLKCPDESDQQYLGPDDPVELRTRIGESVRPVRTSCRKLATALLSLYTNSVSVSGKSLAAEREAGEKRAWLEGLLAAYPEPVLLLDAQGIGVGASPAFMKAMGLACASVTGRPCQDILPREIQGAFDALRQKVLKERTAGEEELTGGPAAAPLKHRLFMAPVCDRSRRILGVVCLLRQTPSEQRVADDFSMDFNHELRTPLNSVIGLTELLLRSGEVPAGLRQHLEGIRQASQELTQTLNCMLDFSALQSENPSFRANDFSIHDVLWAQAETLGAAARAKGLELRFRVDHAIPAFLHGDPLRLRPILLHLISNAVKTLKTGAIDVEIVLARTDGNNPRLRFCLTAAGVHESRESNHEVMRPNDPAEDPRFQARGGIGLDLAYCRRLLELLGSALVIDAHPDGGTCFSFEIAFGPSISHRKTGGPGLGREKLSAWVIDPNAATQALTCAMLGSSGIRAQGYASFPAANAVESASPDLVLINAPLTGDDAADLIHRMASLPAASESRPRVIFLVDEEADGLAAGVARSDCCDFLPKPLNACLLMAQIQRFFNGADKSYVSAVRPTGTEVKMGWLAGVEVLLVEDNAISRAVTGALLESWGAQVSEAANGDEAIKFLGQWQFDVVLMDVQMPVMDGLTAAARIRENPSLRQIPIIAFTAQNSSRDLQNNLQAGMNDHVIKPAEPAHLLQTLLRWTGREAPEILPPPVAVTGAQGEWSIAGFDISDGLTRLAGNKEMFLKILKIFFAEYHDTPDLLRNMKKGGDLDQLHRLVHTIKGAAGNIGAKSVYALASEVEMMIREEYDDLIEPIESLCLELERSLNSIAAHFGEDS